MWHRSMEMDWGLLFLPCGCERNFRTAEVFDFESDSNLSVSVRAFDEAGTYVDKNFSL